MSKPGVTKARTIRARLRSGGIMLMSLRDYAPLMAQRTSSTPASLYSDGKFRRFVHQVWDWQDNRHYVVHLFITMQMSDGWHTRHLSDNTGPSLRVMSRLWRCMLASMMSVF